MSVHGMSFAGQSIPEMTEVGMAMDVGMVVVVVMAGMSGRLPVFGGDVLLSRFLWQVPGWSWGWVRWFPL